MRAEPLDGHFFDNYAVCPVRECGYSEREGDVWRVEWLAEWRCREGHRFTDHHALWEVVPR